MKGLWLSNHNDWIDDEDWIDYDFLVMPLVDDEDWIDLKDRLPEEPEKVERYQSIGKPYFVKATNIKGETKVFLSFYGYFFDEDYEEEDFIWRSDDDYINLVDSISLEKNKTKDVYLKKYPDAWMISHWQYISGIEEDGNGFKKKIAKKQN